MSGIPVKLAPMGPSRGQGRFDLRIFGNDLFHAKNLKNSVQNTTALEILTFAKIQAAKSLSGPSAFHARLEMGSAAGGLLAMKTRFPLNAALVLTATTFLQSAIEVSPAAAQAAASSHPSKPLHQDVEHDTTNHGLAQRVVLYEEGPGDPQGRRASGSVVWSTETKSSDNENMPEFVVRADIDIPERKMEMTWRLRRTTSPSASHTIEFLFKVPPDFTSGDISNVPGIWMKPAERLQGTALAGLAVKVTPGYFLIGLSAAHTDKERNLQLLKDRPWIDIPIVYTNNRRALLSMEKGASGAQAFQQAFAAWNE